MFRHESTNYFENGLQRGGAVSSLEGPQSLVPSHGETAVKISPLRTLNVESNSRIKSERADITSTRLSPLSIPELGPFPSGSKAGACCLLRGPGIFLITDPRVVTLRS